MHYLALLFDREDGPGTPPGTPEFEAEVARYAAFEEAAGHAVVGGVALHPSAEAVSIRPGADGAIVTDGPFAETAEVVGGTVVFEVENLDDALALARQLPVAATGRVELWPMAEFTESPGPQTDWWLALLLEPAGDPVTPGTPEWEAGAAEHARFGERIAPALRGGGALYPPGTATTVRVRDGELLLTDGPFPETAEVANGFYYLAAADRQVAIGLAAQVPLGAHGRVELRQIADLGG